MPDVEVIQRVNEAFGRGDIESVLAALHPEHRVRRALRPAIENDLDRASAAVIQHDRIPVRSLPIAP